MKVPIRIWATVVATLVFVATATQRAAAWGDEGHEVVALIAQTYLTPAVRKKVDALLAADSDPLTAHTMPAAATWADKLRETNEHGARAKTGKWHFVDIEIDSPDLAQACFHHPQIPQGIPASQGPAQDCVVDKVEEFTGELKDPETSPEEQIVALKFVLHLIGDVHQPLHASDAHDRGGNDKRVSAAGFKSGNLHRYWDTRFVARLGPSPRTIAGDLVAHISPTDIQAWSEGNVADWAMESFQMARDDAYGQLPPPTKRGSYRLTDEYVEMATKDVAVQLAKAGVRLALVLNLALQ
jgi:hypothetical protein